MVQAEDIELRQGSAAETKRLMSPEEKADLKKAFGEHWFLRVVALDHECIIALPKSQASDEKEAAVRYGTEAP